MSYRFHNSRNSEFWPWHWKCNLQENVNSVCVWFLWHRGTAKGEICFPITFICLPIKFRYRYNCSYKYIWQFIYFITCNYSQLVRQQPSNSLDTHALMLLASATTDNILTNKIIFKYLTTRHCKYYIMYILYVVSWSWYIK